MIKLFNRKYQKDLQEFQKHLGLEHLRDLTWFNMLEHGFMSRFRAHSSASKEEAAG